MMFDALLKAGGSLYHCPELPAVAATWSKLAQTRRLLLLPGGGPFTHQVRVADAHFQLSDSAAHWMAILGMDQFAYLLADLIPQAVLVRELAAAGDVCAAGRLAVLAPSALLLELDPLPHCWQITSDSIAAWLAGHADIRLLVLLKSVAGVYQSNEQDNAPALLRRVSRQHLAGEDVVDPCFGQLLPPAVNCWIIDGRLPGRLVELLASGQTLGTQVVKPQEFN
ncbi:MAG: hypothetical protein KJ077_13525 [Anaerolineae bacterium]|nr:hypothetical protein [Anaerolineae bacterium]